MTGDAEIDANVEREEKTSTASNTNHHQLGRDDPNWQANASGLSLEKDEIILAFQSTHPCGLVNMSNKVWISHECDCMCSATCQRHMCGIETCGGKERS